MQLGVSYDPAAPDDPKRQLDLYLPAGRDFPIVVFVHGGGWAWGDRTQSFGGADIYRNIGRFLASRGVGAAVIGYRLLWPVDWQSQVGDVARAVAWVQGHAAEHGGRADRIFLMGHSAGAQLAARVAVDPVWLAQERGTLAGICGVVAVSGAGYDLGDIETYRAGLRSAVLRRTLRRQPAGWLVVARRLGPAVSRCGRSALPRHLRHRRSAGPAAAVVARPRGARQGRRHVEARHRARARATNGSSWS